MPHKKCMNITEREILAHMQSIGMSEAMISKVSREQKAQMKQIIEDDPKQQVEILSFMIQLNLTILFHHRKRSCTLEKRARLCRE